MRYSLKHSSVFATVALVIAGCMGGHPNPTGSPSPSTPPEAPWPSLLNGTHVTMEVLPESSVGDPTIKPKKFELTFEHGGLQRNKTGTLYETVRIRTDDCEEFTLGGRIVPDPVFNISTQREIHAFFAANAPALLFDSPQPPAEKPNVTPIQWFADHRSPSFLPHADGELFAYLPLLIWGPTNQEVQIGDDRIRQQVSGMNFSIESSNESVSFSAKGGLNFETGFPSNYSYALETNGSRSQLQWAIKIIDFRRGNGPSLFRASSTPGDGIDRLPKPFVAYKSAGTGLSAWGPAQGPRRIVNLTNAIEAALNFPILTRWWAAEPTDLFVYQILWARANVWTSWLSVGADDVEVDPLRTISPKAATWIVCFQRLGVPSTGEDIFCARFEERVTPAGNRMVQEQSVTMFYYMERVETPTTGVLTFSDAVDHLEFFLPTNVTLDAMEFTVRAMQPDPRIEWSLHAGCWPVAGPPASFLILDAFEPGARFAFFNSNRTISNAPNIEAAGRGVCYPNGPLPPV